MARRTGQSSVKWVVWTVVLVGICAAGAYGAWQYLRPTVTVTEVVRGPVVSAFYSTGTIEPEREYPIKSNTAGILTQLLNDSSGKLVDKGSRVKRDQPLAVISDPALVFTRDKAKAELDEKLRRADEKTSPVLREFDARLSANVEMLELARREESRQREAQEFKGASESTVDKAAEHVQSLWMEGEMVKALRATKKLELDREVEVARAALNIAEWNLDQQTLKSPVDGVVLDRPTSIGTRVAVNDVIMRIADVTPSNLVMRAAVDEEDIARVSVGQSVRMTLYAFPGQVMSGTVSQIYDQADKQRRTFEVDVRLTAANDRLAPGMTGELVFILAEKESANVVPSQALQGGSIYLVRDGRVMKSTASVGLKSVERIEVVDGLRPGDRVIISPVGAAADGQVVRTRFVDPVEAAGLNKPAKIEEAFKAFSH